VGLKFEDAFIREARTRVHRGAWAMGEVRDASYECTWCLETSPPQQARTSYASREEFNAGTGSRFEDADGYIRTLYALYSFLKMTAVELQGSSATIALRDARRCSRTDSVRVAFGR
jgi:hypothetical protein